MLPFAISVSHVPGWTGQWVNLGWPTLGLGLLLAQGREARTSFGHWLVFAFLLYAAASLTWTPDLVSGWIKLAQLVLVGGSFWYGSTLDDLDGVYTGVALGVGVSGLVAGAQWLGLEGILVSGAWPGGLFGNSAVMAQAAALVLVPLVLLKRWWLVPLPALALALGNSRTAWLVLVCAFFNRGWLWVLALLGLSFSLWITRGADVRLEVWDEILRTTTLAGHGLGSFAYSGDWGFVLHAHNDFLELFSELGFLGLGLLLAVYALAFQGNDDVARVTLLCYLLVAFVAFPLFVPLTAFFGGAVAGYLCRSKTWQDGDFKALTI